MAKDPCAAVMRRVKRYEALLVERYGAYGNGLGEKLRSVDDRLPADLVRQILAVNRVRNRLAHELGYSQAVNVGDFERRCRAIDQGLDQVLRQDRKKAQRNPGKKSLLARITRRLRWRGNIG